METAEAVARPEFLPPREYWVGIEPGEKLEIPYDSVGRVDIVGLVNTIKQHISPEYEWRFFPDRHHVPHFEHMYPNEPHLGMHRNLRTFRELPVMSLWVPRDFHELIHEWTEPPKIPEEEVRVWTVESWFVARSLFKHAQKYEEWWRRRENRYDLLIEKPETREKHNGDDTINQEFLETTLQRHFTEYSRRLHELQESMPPEMRMFDLEHDVREIAVASKRAFAKRAVKVNLNADQAIDSLVAVNP